MRHGSWVKDALCPQIDLDVFFPENGESTKDAKRICAACGVKEECLQAAIDMEELHGVWGGKSAWERKKMIEEAQSA